LTNLKSGAYTYNDAHDFLDDISSGARSAVSGNLTGKAFGDDGSFDSNDPTFTGVSGASIEAIVLYVHTGTDSTSRLICTRTLASPACRSRLTEVTFRSPWALVVGSSSDNAPAEPLVRNSHFLEPYGS
jgi:hypothetical protein